MPRLLTRLRFWQPHIPKTQTAFFCSNRYSNKGCGRTLSILWSHLIARTSLAAGDLLKLIAAYSSGQSVHQIWSSGNFPLSLTSAYRWIARWHRQRGHIRSQLARIRPPPHLPGASANTSTFQHLHEAFPQDPCCIAAFQSRLQTDLLP